MATSVSAGAPADVDARGTTAIAMVVAAVFFMEAFDATVIGTALPKMAESFGREPIELSIGLTSYLLALALFVPVSGWVAERAGPRRVFATAIVLYVVASVMCGLANGLGTFTAARIAQGAAGALLIPVGRLVVLRTAARSGLLRAIAFITWPVFAAPVVGPPVGGLLATYASWRWIFFINVPLGVVALVATMRVFPRTMETERRPFDPLGFAYAAIACCGLMFGLEMLSREGAPVVPYVGVVLGSVAMGWLAVRHFHRVDAPLVDLAPMRIPTFVAPMRGGSFFRLSSSAIPFLLPLLFQVGFGMTAFHSGLLLLAVFTGNLLMKPVITRVLRWYGFRNVMMWNGLLSAASIAACGLFTADTPEWMIVIVLFFGGVFRATQATTQITLTFADVPQRAMASASAVSSVIVQLTLAGGVAVGALAVRFVGVVSPEAIGSADQFRWALMLVGVLGMFTLFEARGLAPDAGAEVSRHRKYVRPVEPITALEGA